MTTTHPRRHRLTRIALVTAVTIFSAGGSLSFSGINSQLHEAAMRGDLASIEDLLDRGADIEAREVSGWTALMLASVNDRVAAVELLLDRGADIEARRDDGDTALMWASWYGKVAVVKLLLDRGADIEARDDDGWTALMNASREGHDEVAAVLRAWADEPGGR